MRFFKTAFDPIALKYGAYMMELLSHKMTILKRTKQIDSKRKLSIEVECFWSGFLLFLRDLPVTASIVIWPACAGEPKEKQKPNSLENMRLPASMLGLFDFV